MPKVVCIQQDIGEPDSPPELDSSFDVTIVKNTAEALQAIRQDDYDALYISNSPDAKLTPKSIIENAAMLDLMPDGIALLDNENKIIRANSRLAGWFNKELVGLNFYEALGNPMIVGPEPSPLSTAAVKRKTCKATILVGEDYYRLMVVPVMDDQQRCKQLIVSVVDCTDSVMQRHKLEALHQAGTALADLRPEEIYQMDVEHRIELLKENILHYTKDLLNFDVVEIRLLDHETGLLDPLLSVGIDSTRSKQPLYASPTDNGVTGFVAATGKSYLCEDTNRDPLYLHGLIGAKSSLTVPLIYHDEVIGSFNVESPEVKAFTESDLQFLESFARDIAVALNTLELLNAQQTNTALQSIEAIHAAVALPIDEILNDTVRAIDKYVGEDSEVMDRLQDILGNAREVKRVIQRVGEQYAPDKNVPATIQTEVRPILKDKRILVIDADGEVRSSAHCLLEPYGCIVETAHEGREAVLMVRNCNAANAYDAIIADIRLPDIGGYDLLMRLKEIVQDPPLILMTGFGYDPGHSIVKARQAGLRANAVLFKPFRLDQLLDTVEMTVQATETATK